MFPFIVKFGDRLSVRLRIVAVFALFLLLMALVPVIDLFGALVYFILMTTVTLVGVFDGWVQSGIYAFASVLGPRSIVAVQTGYDFPLTFTQTGRFFMSLLFDLFFFPCNCLRKIPFSMYLTACVWGNDLLE